VRDAEQTNASRRAAWRPANNCAVLHRLHKYLRSGRVRIAFLLSRSSSDDIAGNPCPPEDATGSVNLHIRGGGRCVIAITSGESSFKPCLTGKPWRAGRR